MAVLLLVLIFLKIKEVKTIFIVKPCFVQGNFNFQIGKIFCVLSIIILLSCRIFGERETGDP